MSNLIRRTMLERATEMQRRFEAELFSTGWFGIPGANGRWSTKVHVIVRQDRRPVCGARLSPRQEFQWCAAGIHREYLECQRCRRVVDEAGLGAGHGVLP